MNNELDEHQSFLDRNEEFLETFSKFLFFL